MGYVLAALVVAGCFAPTSPDSPASADAQVEPAHDSLRDGIADGGTPSTSDGGQPSAELYVQDFEWVVQERGAYAWDLELTFEDTRQCTFERDMYIDGRSVPTRFVSGLLSSRNATLSSWAFGGEIYGASVAGNEMHLPDNPVPGSARVGGSTEAVAANETWRIFVLGPDVMPDSRIVLSCDGPVAGRLWVASNVHGMSPATGDGTGFYAGGGGAACHFDQSASMATAGERVLAAVAVRGDDVSRTAYGATGADPSPPVMVQVRSGGGTTEAALDPTKDGLAAQLVTDGAGDVTLGLAYTGPGCPFVVAAAAGMEPAPLAWLDAPTPIPAIP